MGFFDFLFGKKEKIPANSTSNLPETTLTLNASTQEEGQDPPEIKNRAREISWNVWNKPKAGTFFMESLPIVGVTFNNEDGVSRQKILSHMQRGEAVDLVREPNNPDDPYSAVAVVGAMGKIGYIAKDKSAFASEFLNNGFSYLAKIDGPWGGQDGKHYGAKVDIHFMPPEGSTIIKAKVIGISGYNEVGESRKENVEELENGDLLDLQWEEDPIEEKFVVRILPDCTSADIGKLGKKDTKVIFPLLKAGYSYMIAVEENNPEELLVNICLWKKSN